MAVTGNPALDHAPQVVAEWLDELCLDLGWDRPRAQLLLCETLHAIRDFLTVEEAADFAGQLPVLLRGVFYDGWEPSLTPVWPRGKNDLLDRVGARFGETPLEDPERAVAAVFDLLRRHVSCGGIRQVRPARHRPVHEYRG